MINPSLIQSQVGGPSVTGEMGMDQVAELRKALDRQRSPTIFGT